MCFIRNLPGIIKTDDLCFLWQTAQGTSVSSSKGDIPAGLCKEGI